MSVKLKTDAVVTDSSVTGVGNATVHTGLLTGVVNIDVWLKILLKCCSAMAGVANCFANLSKAFVPHDDPIRSILQSVTYTPVQ